MWYGLFLLVCSLLFTGSRCDPSLDKVIKNINDIVDGSIECYDCPGNNPNCANMCDGRYCYKAEFVAHGHSTIKRGCLNATDAGFKVGFCEDIPSTLPGSDTVAVERMCVCTTAKCNLTSAHSMIIALIIAVASFIFFNY